MKLDDGTELRQTVKFTMGLTGVEIEEFAKRRQAERDDWRTAEAKAKALGFSRPYWHAAWDFYTSHEKKPWHSLTSKQQEFAMKIAKALGSQPVLLPFPGSTGEGSAGKSKDLSTLMKRAREMRALEPKRKPPKPAIKRKPKWTWTKTG